MKRETSDKDEECLPLVMMLMGLEFAIACLSCIAHVSPCTWFGGARGCGWDSRDLTRRKAGMENSPSPAHDTAQIVIETLILLRPKAEKFLSSAQFYVEVQKRM